VWQEEGFVLDKDTGPPFGQDESLLVISVYRCFKLAPSAWDFLRGLQLESLHLRLLHLALLLLLLTPPVPGHAPRLVHI
jgi:hypothetical protein